MLGWTQKDLAVRSGVARRSIAGFELETSVPKLETLQRLVATLSRGGIEFRNMETDAIGVMLHTVAETDDGILHEGRISKKTGS